MTFQTLQTIYYVLGIIVMVLGLLFLIALTVAVFYIKKKVDTIHQEVETRLNLLMEQTVKPAEHAISTGVAVAETAIQAARRIAKKKKRR